MNLQVCAVFDMDVQTFGAPIFVPHTGLATRSFVDEVNRSASDNQYNKHPESFQLYVLGEFDDQTGEFRCLDRPKVLINGKDAAVKVN